MREGGGGLWGGGVPIGDDSLQGPSRIVRP